MTIVPTMPAMPAFAVLFAIVVISDWVDDLDIGHISCT
jgi:hypothetical protein